MSDLDELNSLIPGGSAVKKAPSLDDYLSTILPSGPGYAQNSPLMQKQQTPGLADNPMAPTDQSTF